MYIFSVLISCACLASVSSFSGRIINGAPASIGDEFAVRVISLETSTSRSGSLSSGVAVTEHLILTTAQAVHGFESWYVGYDNLDVNQQHFQMVESGYPHPNYDPKFLTFNVAVLRVFAPIHNYIPVSFIASSSSVWFAFGYGVDSVDDSIPSFLALTAFSQFPIRDCRSIYNEKIVPDSNFCGVSSSSLGSGDQGGPVTDIGRNFVFGLISSWGVTPNLPAIFVDFSNKDIRNFIESKLEQTNVSLTLGNK